MNFLTPLFSAVAAGAALLRYSNDTETGTKPSFSLTEPYNSFGSEHTHAPYHDSRKLTATPGTINYIYSKFGSPSQCEFQPCVLLEGSDLNWMSPGGSPASTEKAYKVASCPANGAAISSPISIIGSAGDGSNVVIDYYFDTAQPDGSFFFVCENAATTYSTTECTNCNNAYYSPYPTHAPTTALPTRTPTASPTATAGTELYFRADTGANLNNVEVWGDNVDWLGTTTSAYACYAYNNTANTGPARDISLSSSLFTRSNSYYASGSENACDYPLPTIQANHSYFTICSSAATTFNAACMNAISIPGQLTSISERAGNTIQLNGHYLNWVGDTNGNYTNPSKYKFYLGDSAQYPVATSTTLSSFATYPIISVSNDAIAVNYNPNNFQVDDFAFVCPVGLSGSDVYSTTYCTNYLPITDPGYNVKMSGDWPTATYNDVCTTGFSLNWLNGNEGASYTCYIANNTAQTGPVANSALSSYMHATTYYISQNELCCDYQYPAIASYHNYFFVCSSGALDYTKYLCTNAIATPGTLTSITNNGGNVQLNGAYLNWQGNSTGSYTDPSQYVFYLGIQGQSATTPLTSMLTYPILSVSYNAFLINHPYADLYENDFAFVCAKNSTSFTTTQNSYFCTDIMTFPNNTPQPTHAPTMPTASPSQKPTITPTRVPSAQPTRTPTASPTASPTTLKPTTVSPTRQPTPQPTATPTHSPTATPTTSPTPNPTVIPTHIPTALPTHAPTASPTASPTVSPSHQPTAQPTATPTHSPTVTPTATPTTIAPSVAPGDPTPEPTTAPPTVSPSRAPTSIPTGQPTGEPTGQPTGQPSGQPSGQPTGQPSGQPTGQPTGQPSGQPTGQPSGQPSGQPTGQPTGQPSVRPSGIPSGQPTVQPSTQPTGQPTSGPTGQPTNKPSAKPTPIPTPGPTAKKRPTASPAATHEPTVARQPTQFRFPTPQNGNPQSSIPTTANLAALPSQQPTVSAGSTSESNEKDDPSTLSSGAKIGIGFGVSVLLLSAGIFAKRNFDACKKNQDTANLEKPLFSSNDDSSSSIHHINNLNNP